MLSKDMFSTKIFTQILSVVSKLNHAASIHVYIPTLTQVISCLGENYK